MVLALWDAEEDDKLGSIAAVQSGVLDIDSVVAYLNWDMQGTNLLPSLADTTFVIGAETGGPRSRTRWRRAARPTSCQST